MTLTLTQKERKKEYMRLYMRTYIKSSESIERAKIREKNGGKTNPRTYKKNNKLWDKMSKLGKKNYKKYIESPKAQQELKKRRQDYNKSYRQKPESKLRSKIYHQEYNLKLNFNITLDDYNNLLKSQDDKCAICKNNCFTGRLAVDHDHATNKIRGLLCNHCNTALGKFKDDIDLLKKAIEYLMKHKN